MVAAAAPRKGEGTAGEQVRRARHAAVKLKSGRHEDRDVNFR